MSEIEELSRRLDAQEVALMLIVRASAMKREQLSSIRGGIASLEGPTLGDASFQRVLDDLLGRLERALPAETGR